MEKPKTGLLDKSSINTYATKLRYIQKLSNICNTLLNTKQAELSFPNIEEVTNQADRDNERIDVIGRNLADFQGYGSSIRQTTGRQNYKLGILIDELKLDRLKLTKTRTTADDIIANQPDIDILLAEFSTLDSVK